MALPPEGMKNCLCLPFDKKKRASLKQKCYKPSKIKGFRVFRHLTIFYVSLKFCYVFAYFCFKY